ncbi:MAG: winged helix DNA-binding domain-containing protein [Actinomycetota bacterium]|nr:winged helix DNA-binding domain-containing protein [Actinomycetota bacterium]
MNDRAIARWRMRTMRLSGGTYPSPAAAVEGLLAVQSENHAQASWAVATRTSGVTQAEFHRLFNDGVILRTHVLRPTWHFVRPEDIRWLVELTAPRISRLMVQLQRELELDDSALAASAGAITEALSEGVHLTREALGARLRDGGLPAEGQRLGVMVAHAEMSALICSGAMQGKNHTYALLDERAPEARRLDRDDALAELVLRYFNGHGPATERDLAYWATMTLTDVRTGLAAVADQLDHLRHEGRTFWFKDPPPDDARLDPRAHLLQVLDEYHHGCQDSRHVLDVDGLVPRGRGASMGMVLVDGQMVGDMRRRIRGDKATFEIGLFRDLDDDELGAVRVAAHRYGRFLGLDPIVVTAPADAHRV